MNRSEQMNELAAALSKAQGEFPVIPKTKKAKVPMKGGGSYEYMYADLADVISITAPVLSKNGLSVSQEIQYHPDKDLLLLETVIMHASGQWRTSVYPLRQFDRPQEQGSEITYGRRYALTAALGIHADEDDDGSGAQNGERRSSNVAKKMEQKLPPKQPTRNEAPATQAEKTLVIEMLKNRKLLGDEFSRFIDVVYGLKNNSSAGMLKWQVQELERLARDESTTPATWTARVEAAERAKEKDLPPNG